MSQEPWRLKTYKKAFRLKTKNKARTITLQLGRMIVERSAFRYVVHLITLPASIGSLTSSLQGRHIRGAVQPGDFHWAGASFWHLHWFKLYLRTFITHLIY